jgi:hypothetical protein
MWAMNPQDNEPTETDERIAENRTPAPVVNPSGAPDDRRSPIDKVFYDPDSEPKPA